MAAGVVLVSACSAMPEGDQQACDEFLASADTVAAFMGAVSSGDASAQQDYRDASADHSTRLLGAAGMAETDTLSTDLADAAALWSADDATAYYLTEADLRDVCA